MGSYSSVDEPTLVAVTYSSCFPGPSNMCQNSVAPCEGCSAALKAWETWRGMEVGWTEGQSGGALSPSQSLGGKAYGE